MAVYHILVWRPECYHNELIHVICYKEYTATISIDHNDVVVIYLYITFHTNMTIPIMLLHGVILYRQINIYFNYVVEQVIQMHFQRNLYDMSKYITWIH